MAGLRTYEHPLPCDRCTQVAAFAQANGYKPHLAIVTVGERPLEEAQRCVWVVNLLIKFVV